MIKVIDLNSALSGFKVQSFLPCSLVVGGVGGWGEQGRKEQRSPGGQGSRRDSYAPDPDAVAPYARGNLLPTDSPLETGDLLGWKHKTLGKTMSQRKDS